MRQNPTYALDDVEAIKDLIRAYPWCTLISHVPGSGLIASHYPVLLEEDAEGIVLLSHMGRPDDARHGLGAQAGEMLAIISGPHGYISPGWYGSRPNVPTWNFSTAHLWGTPEVLSDADNLAVLDRLVTHFESPLPEPHLLHGTLENSEYAHRIVRGTVGIRLPITRIEGKEKMNQNKEPETIRRIIDHLEQPGPYRNPALADRMKQANKAVLD